MQAKTKKVICQKLAGATLVACLVPLLHGCGSGTADNTTSSTDTTTTTNTTAATTDNASTNTASADAKLLDGWQTVSAEGFDVAMPGEPKKTKDTKHDGYDWDIEKAGVDYDASYMNQAGMDKLSPKDTEALVEKTATSMGGQGKVSGKKSITVDGHPGVEQTVTTTKGLDMRMKMLASGNRLYLLLVTAPKGKITTPEADQFTNSFKFTGDAASADTAAKSDNAASGNTASDNTASGNAATDNTATDNAAKPDATTAP